MEKKQIVLNYKGKIVYKERNDWLVLTRTLLAGFNAPIDTVAVFSTMRSLLIVPANPIIQVSL
jgi:hypothetical protein